MSIGKIDLNLFTKSYLDTASWITYEGHEDITFNEQSVAKAKYDCLKFIMAVKKHFGLELCVELLSVEGSDCPYLAGHDFFLTRNGHGAGFWDSPEMYGGQENADKLTEIANSFGNVDCYVSKRYLSF